MTRGHWTRAFAGASLFLLANAAHAQSAPATPAAAPVDIQAAADKIAKEVEQIRGLPFKHPVKVENQSTEEFSQYVSRELDESVPESIRRHYGLIVRTLGLYRGPAIEDFSTMMTMVMSSQAAAYYDPEKRSFFVLMGGMPDMMQGVLFSHELYHALQDQHFGLVQYMEDAKQGGVPRRNSDSNLARSAVVEGEATYLMMLWMIQHMSGQVPPREVMAQVVAQTSNVNMAQMRESLKQPQVAQALGTDLQSAIESADRIPAFIMDTMMGVYFKGMGFVFAIHEQGWSAVEKLYRDYPPQSTEQLLHPEKWLAREAPVGFEWPKFSKARALRDWELLDEDVIGEFGWRIIFKEQGFEPQAEAAAGGWAGDRYAVFKRKDSDAALLLLRTSWDSETDAGEFAEVYGRVQAAKYADAPVPVRLVRKGTEVFIVEGGDAAQADALLKLVRSVKPARAARN